MLKIRTRTYYKLDSEEEKRLLEKYGASPPPTAKAEEKPSPEPEEASVSSVKPEDKKSSEATPKKDEQEASSQNTTAKTKGIPLTLSRTVFYDLLNFILAAFLILISFPIINETVNSSEIDRAHSIVNITCAFALAFFVIRRHIKLGKANKSGHDTANQKPYGIVREVFVDILILGIAVGGEFLVLYIEDEYLDDWLLHALPYNIFEFISDYFVIPYVLGLFVLILSYFRSLNIIEINYMDTMKKNRISLFSMMLKEFLFTLLSIGIVCAAFFALNAINGSEDFDLTLIRTLICSYFVFGALALITFIRHIQFRVKLSKLKKDEK